MCWNNFQVFEVYGLSEVVAATLTLMSEHDTGKSESQSLKKKV